MNFFSVRCLSRCLCILALFLFSQAGYARPEYLDAFKLRYDQPAFQNSKTGDAECQVCHVSPGGNSPWNAYGDALRSLGALTDINLRMQTVESNNSDGAAGNNLAEIEASTQPGWSVGETNTYFPSMGPNVLNQPPPTSLPAGVLVDPGATAAPGSTNDPISGPIPRGTITINFETIATGLTDPVFIQRLSGENNLYIVERLGQVKRVNLDAPSVLDYLNFNLLENDLEAGGEKGLLGFAFHPNFTNNNKVYTYTSEGIDGAPTFPTTMPMGQNPEHQTVITEWEVENHGSSPATVTNRRVLMRIDQPQDNHNGGTIEFGPDGFLYIGLGDGGSSNDSGTGHPLEGNSQAYENPLGSILRIDADGSNSSNGEYGIPLGLVGNPFTGGLPGLDEAYAYGFRNPYRFSINDLGSGDFEIYVGDVGQGDIEEISVIHSDEPGGNYGWKLKEGSFFFYDDNTICNNSAPCVSTDPPQNVPLPNMQDPLVEYDHDEGISVIGGHVYKGSDISDLSNLYVFGEFFSLGQSQGRLFYIDQTREMREFRYENPIATSITSLGRDNDGELYFVGGFGSGVLMKIIQGEIDDELCLPIRASNGNISVICL